MPILSWRRVTRASSSISESEYEPELESKPYPEGELVSTSSGTSKTPTPRQVVSKGFLALPVELLSHITSYFAEIRDEHLLMSTHYIGSGSNPEDLLLRFNALRTLSQLSHLSRSIFLPLLWERFQVCLTPKPGWQWHSYIGHAMQRKSIGLLESKHLWPYVKVVTIAISQFKSSQVIPPFVQLLGMLPNVHTLEVLYVTIDVPSPASFETYFRGYTFPSIQKIVLPAYAREILRCCPNLKEVTCNRDYGECGQLVDTLIHIGFPNLEVVRGFTIGVVPLKRLTKVSPSLQCTKDVLRLSAYSVLRSLRTIEIECFENNVLGKTVKLASDVLRSCAVYKPTTKERDLRGSINGAIRILRYAYSDIYGRTPSDFVPVRVEEFLVKV
ncbi:hypothetical protein B0J17DRAFT_639775 [Rhizoctonia solani]|nr:hypothetical protein B0J17DRAFT_639775 [Rhizoctonia solani]